jgi:hydrogenase maturation protein HypF
MNTVARNIATTATVARRLTLSGLVQGIGLRPEIARLAQRLVLTGFVSNTNSGVEVHIEGSPAAVQRFGEQWRGQLPAAAKISAQCSQPVEPVGYSSFVVCSGNPSMQCSTIPQELEGAEKLSAQVPTDVVICQQCLDELQDPQNVRNNYPFTTCSHCGPRYSIIKTMPFERQQTSMSQFEMCENCRGEYTAPNNRRFHAQTNACPACGPQIWMRNANDQQIARQHEALQAAAAAILQGQIVALRGLGGYQLLVDATSQTAVQRLRQRKQRDSKPLAVMVQSLAEASKLARIDDSEQSLLCSPAGPIVLLAAHTPSVVAASVSCGLNTIGLMLPTTALHWLLLEAVGRPMVCTSGNKDGQPIVTAAGQALEELKDIADLWLEHDREIIRPVDDSVVRVIAGRTVGLRLARGYAPLGLELDSTEVFSAGGGHQKVSLAISSGAQAVLGPHLGDMDTLASRQRFTEQQQSLLTLYKVTCPKGACDLHPDYFTSQQAAESDVLPVQHHHAHIVAGMIEQGWLDRIVLGVAFDGTGLGCDGTIWGGEFLQATATGFERVGHLRPFPMIGGELAVRQPWRIAVALVSEACGESAAASLKFRSNNSAALTHLLRKTSLATVTTSAGRLFDGIASLILGVETCQYEGQAAMLLESACDLEASGQYDLVIEATTPRVVDWRPLVQQVLHDRAADVCPAAMAMRFHRGLANAIFVLCTDWALPVVLSGGVFQNRILVELLAQRFQQSGREVGLPGLIPPNDGGLAAGQLAIGIAIAQQLRSTACV